jgi:hypothetical protein
MNTLDMTSIHSVENQKISVEMATGDINNLKASVYKVETIMNSPQSKLTVAVL